jgi:hypothetical protein
MKVITLKLTSGEELIAKHQETLDDSSHFVLEDARRLQLVPNGKGGTGLALMPLLMSNVEKGDFTIDKRHVVIATEVDGTFEKQYLQEVSGIQLVS